MSSNLREAPPTSLWLGTRRRRGHAAQREAFVKISYRFFLSPDMLFIFNVVDDAPTSQLAEYEKIGIGFQNIADGHAEPQLTLSVDELIQLYDFTRTCHLATTSPSPRAEEKCKATAAATHNQEQRTNAFHLSDTLRARLVPDQERLRWWPEGVPKEQSFVVLESATFALIYRTVGETPSDEQRIDTPRRTNRIYLRADAFQSLSYALDLCIQLLHENKENIPSLFAGCGANAADFSNVSDERFFSLPTHSVEYWIFCNACSSIRISMSIDDELKLELQELAFASRQFGASSACCTEQELLCLHSSGHRLTFRLRNEIRRLFDCAHEVDDEYKNLLQANAVAIACDGTAPTRRLFLSGTKSILLRYDAQSVELSLDVEEINMHLIGRSDNDATTKTMSTNGGTASESALFVIHFEKALDLVKGLKNAEHILRMTTSGVFVDEDDEAGTSPTHSPSMSTSASSSA